MRKSVWLLVVLPAAAAAAIYSGVWYATAVFVREQTLQWLAARAPQGLTVTHGAPTLTGFPFKAEAVFPEIGVAVKGGKEGPGWTWRAPALRVFARPFVFNRFSVDLAGAHRFTGMEAQDTALNLEQGLATFILGPNGIARAGITVTNAVTAHGAVEKAEADITVQETGLHIDLSAARTALPDILPPPLSRTVETLKASLDFTSAIPTGAPLPEVLDAWRTAGGTVEVRDFEIDWPPISGKGSGTLALDKALQPEGAFNGTFSGFMAVVDMLVAGGRMEPQEAALARSALTLLARTPHEGAPPELKVAVTVQDRKVYAGPVTLMELPKITWRKDVIVP